MNIISGIRSVFWRQNNNIWWWKLQSLLPTNWTILMVERLKPFCTRMWGWVLMGWRVGAVVMVMALFYQQLPAPPIVIGTYMGPQGDVCYSHASVDKLIDTWYNGFNCSWFLAFLAEFEIKSWKQCRMIWDHLDLISCYCDFLLK